MTRAMNPGAKNWERIAEREPYFGVLTDERFLRERMSDGALREFFASGEGDVERLFALARRVAGEDFAPHRALDFGCGVGRLTQALARRCEEAVGVDVSPRMLELARSHAATRPNITFTDAVPDATFDFVISLIVFQHIEVARGMSILREVLARVAPGGVVALQFTLRRPGGVMRRAARRLRANVPLVHAIAQVVAGERMRLPYMEMNEYDERAIVDAMHAAGFGEPLREATNHGGVAGAIFVARKSA